ncbi:hypothetical protein B0H11DRAFT_2248147 [Mycena galericulata]|nr:hypothetical protein B0H11DRAFT_2248147 [Mycena galericulata]
MSDTLGPIAENKEGIEDRTETNIVNLRRTIYLSIMNAVGYEEAVYKLLKVQLQEGQEVAISPLSVTRMRPRVASPTLKTL